MNQNGTPELELPEHESNEHLYDLKKTLDSKYKNPDFAGEFLGTVIKAPPELEIQIDEEIIIKKHQIHVNKQDTSGYIREYSQEGEIEITVDEIDITDSSNQDSGGNIHNKIVATGTLKGTYTATGQNTWTDDLKEGDKVFLQTFLNNKQMWKLTGQSYQYGSEE